MKLIESTELQTFQNAHPNWTLHEGQLTQTIEFKDFPAAITFVNQVAELAEKAAHHPDIDIRYNKVKFALTTHDAGGITQNDINLATEIDRKMQE